RSTCPPVDGEDDPAVDAQVRRHHVETLRPHTALEDRLHERRAPGVRLMSTFFTGSPSSPSAPSTGVVDRVAAQRLAQPAHLAASAPAWWTATMEAATGWIAAGSEVPVSSSSSYVMRPGPPAV